MSVLREVRRIAAAHIGAALALAAPAAVGAAILIDCDDGRVGADGIHRGFYITSFPGSALEGVDLYLSSGIAGDYTVSLTARADTYDGPLVGTSQVSVPLTGDMNPVEVHFAFPTSYVTTGSTLTFALSLVAGPDRPYYGVRTYVDPCPIIETEGTTPPLDVYRHEGIRVTVYGLEASPVQTSTWGVVKAEYR